MAAAQVRVRDLTHPVATCLDHVGLLSARADTLHAAYARLGFALTPLSRQSGRAVPGGLVVPFGTANRCAMLEDGYLELQGIVDASAPLNGVDRYLARYAGAHIIALGMDDAEANLARLRRAGLDVAGPLPLQRRVDDADPASPLARFTLLPLPDAPEGRIQLVQHLTPELLWHPGTTAHPNQVRGLDGAILAVPDPASTAARFARLAGRPVVPDPAGGFRLDLARGWIRLLPPAALGQVLPGIEPPALPWVAGLALRTADGAAAMRHLAAGLPQREAPDGLLLLPAAAGGVALILR